MTLLVSLEQAVSTSLRNWLASQLNGCVVFDAWPDPETELPNPAIAILREGPPQVQDLDSKVINRVLVSGNTYVYTHRIAQCELPIQLDMWAETTPTRDDLIARTVIALHAGKAQTLAAYLASVGNATTQPPVENTITLQLAGTWAHVLAQYLFEQPVNADDPDRVKQRIYRCSMHGTAYYDLTIDSNSPILNTIFLKEYVQRALTPWTAGSPRHITTITATTITQSDGTT